MSRPLLVLLLSVGLGAGLAACSRQPPILYPDDAWNVGTEGDVVVESCPNSQTRVVSGPPELGPAALQMASGEPRPPACKSTTYAFRKHPAPDEVARLLDLDDTVLVTRGLEKPRKVACPPSVTYPDEGHRDGVSLAVLTIEPSGQVASLELKKSNGSANETRWADWLKACTFSPASIDGKPFQAHFQSRTDWGNSGP